MFGPHRHAVGIYYLPILYIVHHVGLTQREVGKAFDVLESVEFAFYDPPSEHVWIPNMARMQIGESLVEADKKWINVIRELKRLVPQIPRFVAEFCDLYGDTYKLKEISDLASPFEGASKGLRSKEKESGFRNQDSGEGKGSGEGEEIVPPAAPTPPASSGTESQDPVFITIPTNRAHSGLMDKDYPVTEAKVAEYQETYPGVDVRQVLRGMRQWSMDNPTKRKTLRGMPAFMNRWLSKEQDRPKNQQRNPGGMKPIEEHLQEIERDVADVLETGKMPS